MQVVVQFNEKFGKFQASRVRLLLVGRKGFETAQLNLNISLHIYAKSERGQKVRVNCHWQLAWLKLLHF